MLKIQRMIILTIVLVMTDTPLTLTAKKYGYQPTQPPVKNIDRARIITSETNLKSGFSYIFKENVKYTPKYNTYIVGQHCYRGKAIRFDIPQKKFIFYIDNKKYIPHFGGGNSVWHRFYTDSRLNFILKWLGGGYSVVELNQDSCADIVLDTRYHLEEKLKR